MGWRDFIPSVVMEPFQPAEVTPVPKVWLTETGELRTSGHIDDLAGEIVKLTADNLPQQRHLLTRHCEAFDKQHIWKRWEDWRERAAILEYQERFTRKEAELEAARRLNLLAFLDELQTDRKEAVNG